MAIKLPGGRIMRTLPEQVDKNMQDIASINNEVNVIKESITTAYKIQGSATVADLNANTPDAAMNGYVYNMTDAGYLINSDESTTSVQIGDNVVLVWNEGNYFWDCLSGVVDTSNLVTLDTEQTITGLKTFDSPIKLNTTSDKAIEIGTSGNNGGRIGVSAGGLYLVSINGTVGINSNVRPYVNNTYDFGVNGYAWRDIYFTRNLFGLEARVSYVGVSGSILNTKCTLAPDSPNAYDIGIVSRPFKNLYLSGNISDGTNSVTVAQISKTKLYKHQMTVSNVTGPVNVILTNNTPITGSFGANMSSQIVIAAYLTAQSNASQMKTPNGGLAQINSDGTISITVSVGETITDDTVTEL